MNDRDPIKQQRRLGVVMQGFAWLVFLLLAGLFFSEQLQRQRNPNQDLQTRYGEDRIREVSLQRNRQGHYVSSGTINSQPVVFIIDTGATGVAIPEAVARELGLRRGRAFTTQTANGSGVAYGATLDSVSIGDIVLHDIPASITPGLQLNEVLLGMSFLKHIEFTQRGSSLILRQGF